MVAVARAWVSVGVTAWAAVLVLMVGTLGWDLATSRLRRM